MLITIANVRSHCDITAIKANIESGTADKWYPDLQMQSIAKVIEYSNKSFIIKAYESSNVAIIQYK